MRWIKLWTLAVAVLYTPTADADTFGSAANQFDIEFVNIGSPDNPDDTTGDPRPAGKVEYFYRIGKYEISEDMINKANTLGGLDITHNHRGANKPATSLSWYEAATFVNWLNTSTGYTPAYKFTGSTFELWDADDTGYDPNNRYRNSRAHYFLPSADEWYKAAYYDSVAGVYYGYPTGSNAEPTPVYSGTSAGTAVYLRSSATGPAVITLAGGLSPYGTMGQGGNVWEWEETERDLTNDGSSDRRGLRGGRWTSYSIIMHKNWRQIEDASNESEGTGLRVASLLSVLEGDYNGDGVVNLADYTVWRDNLGATGLEPFQQGDGTGDGNVTVEDYDIWKSHFGESLAQSALWKSNAVPEPSTLVLLALFSLAMMCHYRMGRPNSASSIAGP